MDEIAQRNIVFDFEIITLIALALGLMVHALGQRIFGKRIHRTASPFEMVDLVLMFIPALIFLSPAVLQIFFPVQREPLNSTGQASGILWSLLNLGFYGFVLILIYAILEWIRDIRIVPTFGLGRLSLPVILLIAILGGVASLLLCGLVLGNLSLDLLSGIFKDLKEQAPVKEFRNSAGGVTFWLNVAMACAAAPVVEELLFRGYIFATLKSFTSPVFAMVISSALFAAAHANLGALIPLWGLAILLVVSYEATKCLWVPIGIHAFFNAANIVLMFHNTPTAGGTQ